MARIQASLALLALCVAHTLAASVSDASPERRQVDVKSASSQLVADLRQLSSQAKNGLSVETIAQTVLDLQEDAQDLIQDLDDDVSQCETDLVIKTAATGIGSHEVLTLLLADDELKVLNGRLSLSLAFLERVAQQLEDQLSVSTDVGPQLAAIVFGTNATASIAETADIIVTTVTTLTDEDNTVRRQATDLRLLGNGWSVGQKDGVRWQSSVGRASVFLRPKAALLQEGVSVAKRGSRNSLSVNPTYTEQGGLGVSGSWKHQFKDDRGGFHVSPSWSQGGGFGVKAGFTFNF